MKHTKIIQTEMAASQRFRLGKPHLHRVKIAISLRQVATITGMYFVSLVYRAPALPAREIASLFFPATVTLIKINQK
jgi:hypothetical protein